MSTGALVDSHMTFLRHTPKSGPAHPDQLKDLLAREDPIRRHLLASGRPFIYRPSQSLAVVALLLVLDRLALSQLLQNALGEVSAAASSRTSKEAERCSATLRLVP